MGAATTEDINLLLQEARDDTDVGSSSDSGPGHLELGQGSDAFHPSAYSPFDFSYQGPGAPFAAGGRASEYKAEGSVARASASVSPANVWYRSMSSAEVDLWQLLFPNVAFRAGGGRKQLLAWKQEDGSSGKPQHCHSYSDSPQLMHLCSSSDSANRKSRYL